MNPPPQSCLKRSGKAAKSTKAQAFTPLEALQFLQHPKVDPHLVIIERVLSRETEEYDVEGARALAAQALIGDSVNVHPGEKIGYVITTAKAKNKAE
jgi:DNA polymerase elongation subunit (family B)